MEASELDWIDCHNDATGLAFSSATGGTAPYSFLWTDTAEYMDRRYCELR